MTSDQPGDPARAVPAGDPPEGDADRLALLWNGFEELTTRLDTTEDALAGTLEALSSDVDDLKTQLTQLLQKEQEKDVKPQRWAARATSKDWNNLMDWVDQLNADYSLLSEFVIPPCWPAHPGAVEELAGLWRSWIRSLIADERGQKNGSNDLTAWHDRWLWPSLHRLKSGHYRTTNCRNGHQPERSPAAPTDRALLPAPATKPRTR